MTTEMTGSNEQPAEPVSADGTLIGGAITPEPANPTPQPDTIGQNVEAALDAAVQTEQAANWRTSLPEELQASPALAKYNDVAALAKAYINAEKAIGADKITVPDKHATVEDYKNIFHKLGLPSRLEDYKLNQPQVPLQDGELTAFKQAAFEAGIMPSQMQNLMEWYAVRQNNVEKEATAQYEAAMEEQKVMLKKEWGEKFNQNLQRVQEMTRGVAEALGEEQVNNFLSTQLNGQPLGNNPFMIRLFEHFANMMNVDEIHEGVSPKMMAPHEIQGKLDSIMGNFDHPYYQKEHPSHKAAVKEVQSYFERLNPSKKKTSIF